MYDGPTDEWLVRETGVMVEVPEISGHLFVGRSKEGFSLNKIMVGYAGWTQERSTINDATIPILADGVKWLGYAPQIHLLWNLGAYADWLSEGQGFSTYDNQFVGRVAWLPFLSTDGGRLLHLGVNLRYGHPNEGTLKLRSRPESFPSPYVVDTGDFAAKEHTDDLARGLLTTRLRCLIWLGVLLSEWPDALNRAIRSFHGGEVRRRRGSSRARPVPTHTLADSSIRWSPARPVFQAGREAWVARRALSRISISTAVSLRGGRFWRLTPMSNWYPVRPRSASR
jgi:phosphate-selective porin OprO/OprP